jgi:hypothetical protein
MKRILAAILAIIHGVNGLDMLFDGSGWWARIPGVGDTGPFNPHFVQDVGAAFLAAALGLAARAWRPAWWPAAMAGAAFLAIHAAIHLEMIAMGMNRHAAIDLVIVVLPAALSVYAASPTRPG